MRRSFLELRERKFSKPVQLNFGSFVFLSTIYLFFFLSRKCSSSIRKKSSSDSKNSFAFDCAVLFCFPLLSFNFDPCLPLNEHSKVQNDCTVEWIFFYSLRAPDWLILSRRRDCHPIRGTVCCDCEFVNACIISSPLIVILCCNVFTFGNDCDNSFVSRFNNGSYTNIHLRAEYTNAIRRNISFIFILIDIRKFFLFKYSIRKYDCFYRKILVYFNEVPLRISRCEYFQLIICRENLEFYTKKISQEV